MKRITGLLTGFFIGMFWVGTASAAEPIIYPKEKQTKEQMEKDKFECYTWAKEQTGFDPMQPVAVSPPAPAGSQGPKGERLVGAARGAAVGAVVGEIASDDAGKGAAAGAAAGAMAGGMKKRQNQRNQAQAQQEKGQQEQAALAQKRDAYNRAHGACLEGRGYTVK
jgi:hypothetical protein